MVKRILSTPGSSFTLMYHTFMCVLISSAKLIGPNVRCVAPVRDDKLFHCPTATASSSVSVSVAEINEAD